MVKLKCKHCGYKWDYNGKMKVQATCPDCMKKIKIKKE